MKFGLSDSHWAMVEQLAIRRLKELGAVVYVFGSRARGDQREFSDLDLLIESEDPIPLNELGAIREALEQSDLPVKVDLVERRDLAQAFTDRVLRERVRV